MKAFFKNLRANWQTSVAGAVAIAAAGGATWNGTPIDAESLTQLAIGFGLLFAKDAKVTGVPR